MRLKLSRRFSRNMIYDNSKCVRYVVSVRGARRSPKSSSLALGRYLDGWAPVRGLHIETLSGKREAGSGKREEEEHRREWLRWHSQEGNLRREESERKKGEREGWHMYTQGHSRTGGTTNNKNKNISNVWFIFFQLYWPWKKKPENHKRLCSLEVCNPLTFGEHNGSFWPILRL